MIDRKLTYENAEWTFTHVTSDIWKAQSRTEPDSDYIAESHLLKQIASGFVRPAEAKPEDTIVIVTGLPSDIYPQGVRFAIYEGKLDRDEAIGKVEEDIEESYNEEQVTVIHFLRGDVTRWEYVEFEE